MYMEWMPKAGPVFPRKMSRTKLKTMLSNLSPCLVGVEACGRAHWWGREIQALGHEARLMAPQFVKPFVKSNKNDKADAEAICEAVQRPNMRFVGIKSPDQQAQQFIHRSPFPCRGQPHGACQRDPGNVGRVWD